MATNNSFVEDLKEWHLCCSICQDTFERPKALPCLHTFCEGCLRDYTVSRFSGSPQFTCPMCRQTIEMPPRGVAGFPDNHLIVGLLDTVGSSRQSARLSSDVAYTRKNDNEEASLLLEKTVSKSTSSRPDVDCRYLDEMNTLVLFGSDASQCQSIAGISFCPLDGNICIADPKSVKVVIYSHDGLFKNAFHVDGHLKDIVATKFGTVILSADNIGSGIMEEFTCAGKKLATYGNVYKFEVPNGIALSEKNKVFISCLQSNSIRVFTDRKKPSVTFGTKGSGAKHFMSPYYLCVNSKCDVIVSDTGNHRVKVYSNSGEFKFHFGKQGSEQGNLFYPMGVAVDRFDNIYVADANNYRVQVFSGDGQYMCSPITSTHMIGLDVKPIAIDINTSNGQMAVALRGTNCCQVQMYRITAEMGPLGRTSSRPSGNLFNSLVGNCFGFCFNPSSQYEKL